MEASDHPASTFSAANVMASACSGDHLVGAGAVVAFVAWT